jgi:hypothetical protein
MGHMAKTKSKTKARGASSKPAVRVTKSVDVASLRQSLTRMVAVAASDMVKAAIGEAKKGHSTALKYLFEMVGVYPPALETEQAEKREMSLAELFCRELGLPMRAPDTVEKELEAQADDPETTGSDAVE